MSVIFKLVIASLATYKPNQEPPPKRGRPPKTIYDIDRTKVDEVIHDDKKPADGLRGQTSFGKARRKNRQN